MKNERLVDKDDLSLVIRKNLNADINIDHIHTVVNIIIEEILKELLEGKVLKVKNLCDFAIVKTSRIMKVNVTNGIKQMTGGNKILKIYMWNELKLLLSKHLDSILDDPYV